MIKNCWIGLKVGQLSEIRGHLMADQEFQEKSVRFIENHDEERAISSFGQDKSKAAAIIMSTIPGMKLYHDGQFLAKKIKTSCSIRQRTQ